MREMEDLELVSAVQAGDSDAYGELFERYQSRIYNFTYSILGNAEDARDVTQDAFVRVFEALPRKEHVEFSAYLYRAARNAAYDAAKSRGRYDGGVEDMDFVEESSMYADPERSTLFTEQQSVVRGALTVLSEEHRAILMLREVQELSYQQIADALDMTRTNVGVTIMRARLKFKGAFRMSHVDVDSLCAECQAMLPLLSAYIDDELKPDQRERVEAHLDDCPLCRYALDEMREASKSYRVFVPLIPPEAMKAEVLWRVSRLGADAGDVGSRGAPDGAASGEPAGPVTAGAGDGLGGAGEADGLGGAEGAGEADREVVFRGPGSRLAISLGAVALVAVGVIVFALLNTPGDRGAAVLSWGSWRGALKRPAIVAPAVTDAPADDIVVEDYEPAEEPAADGSQGGANIIDDPSIFLLIPRFIPRFQMRTPTDTVQPPLY